MQQNKQTKQLKLKKIKKVVKKQERVSILISFLYMFNMSDLTHRSFQKEEDLDNNIPFNFYFKTMKGVDFQTDIITLNIKTIKKTIKPFSEYTERFREVSQNGENSLLYDWGVSFQFVYAGLKAVIDRYASIDHNPILAKILQKLKGQDFIIAVIQQKQGQICIGRIIISRALVQKMGYCIEDLKLDYIKYQHVYFEIMKQDFFKRLYVQQGIRIKQLLKQQQSNEANQKNKQSQNNENIKKQGLMPNSDPDKPGFMSFDDFVYRKKKQTQGIFEQKLNAVIQLYKPHPKIGMIEFHIDQQNVIQTIQISDKSQAKGKYQQAYQKISQAQQKKSLSDIININA